VLECYDDAASFDDEVGVAGATTNSSYFRVIKPATGQGHDGTPNNGVFFHRTTAYTNFHIINASEAYFQLQDIIFKATQNDLKSSYCIGIGGNGGSAIGVICFDSTNAGGGYLGGLIINGASATIYIVNCICANNQPPANRGDFDISSSATGSTVYFYNCTGWDSAQYNFNHAGGTGVAKNCISEGGTVGNWNGTWTKTTCTDGDGVVFENSAGDDLSLDSTDAAARENGTDLSADANYAFDDDIVGRTRPINADWDIGAWEDSSTWTPPTTGWEGLIFGIRNPGKVLGIADINNIMGV
jgi:hypothetical protein